MADQKERSEIQEYVSRSLSDETKWTRAWSALYHGFLFSASILSAAAAVILQLKSITWADQSRMDIATVITALASLIGVISVSGGFGRKWRANRMTKATLEQLEIELMDADCDYKKIRKKLEEMKRVHHLAIVGEDESKKHAEKKI